MKPQEKAQELINSFSPHAKNWDCFYDIPLDKNHAKECALIAVEEIIAQIEPSVSMDVISARINYWQEVKQEIEKPMKPKEQAEQLLHEYRMLFMDEGEDYGQEILVTMLSIKCSLIAVDKILSLFISESEDTRYWLEVKQEIEKI
jgi:hypothetical protein